MDKHLTSDLEFMAHLSEDELNEIAGSQGSSKDFGKGKDDDDSNDGRDDFDFDFKFGDDDFDFKFKFTIPKRFVPKNRSFVMKKFPFNFKSNSIVVFKQVFTINSH
ncbi:hypothetical protein BJP34_19165 [Moorena producens PAL-8-15-08-1]|uniref:Uncharacterized protein n=1 Tax=Moorena producens PAL-8-15-08-1 TaxID=1458985 RepID=A0A1D8TUK5_9CYAN|nr:hypothetical protein [Moorena producens]AOX01274.1 hypothetical protein BJP34_19165 [Moorena producens PAL-8-15-08-1]